MATQYDTDFYVWTQRQAKVLRRMAAERANSELDLEHLAEEIESVGKSDRRELHSRLAHIIEHLLKLGESTLNKPRHGWRSSVRAERISLERLFQQSRHCDRSRAPRWKRRSVTRVAGSNIS